jgi:RimJ/RimL family protein N-acetyltransferase
MTMTPLRGRKVILREKQLTDAPNDYRWRTNPELARLDATLPIRMSFEKYRELFEDELLNPSARVLRLAVETLQGKHIGNCMYYDADFIKSEAELGILIGDTDYWDQGYGTDAVDMMLRHIFTSTPLRRIYLHTLDWNQRAQLSFAKSGFASVRNVRRSGYNFVLMETSREEWTRLEERRVREEIGRESAGREADGASLLNPPTPARE